MKKITALTLALAIVLSFTACGGGGIGKGKGIIPSEQYAKYTELKTNAYNRITEKISEHDELAITAGLALLPVTMLDLTLMPLTIIGTEGGAAALALFGMQGITVDQKGDVYTVTYSSDGESVTQTCEYDSKTDSMQSVLSSSSSGESLVFEYVKSGSGYSSQYATKEGESEYTVVKMYFDAENEVAIGLDASSAKPESIFKKTGLNAEFVKNNSSYFILKDGKLTIFTDGESKTY